VHNPNLNSIKPGDEISGVYVLRGKKLLPYRDGSGYFLGLTLADKTGQVEGRVWEQAEEVYGRCRAGDVVEITGRVTEYNGSVQLQITSLTRCDDEQVAPERFIPSSGITREEVREEWLRIAGTINNPYLKQLLILVARDPDLLNAFAACPAARRNHHALLGGLWQHSLGVAKAAEGIAAVYPRVDRDLLVTGALLHDIGKIEEYRAGTDINITDAGRLLGHIVLGAGLVDRLIAQIPGFPRVLRLKLLHMIVSHHGRYEWQSPKRPKFLEAAILHQLDMIDAQVDMFGEAAAAREDAEDSWTGWIKSLDRFVFCG
jgi:3'-5' exoribonuclease